MSDIALTAAVRQNLLSLQSTTDLIARTQNRLSTGLSVSSAIDDPVSFFQAKALQDRSSDFDEKKQAIDQGISSLTASSDAVEGIENLVKQIKGLAVNAKSATSDAEINSIVFQFNDLRQQVNHLAGDASYQGLNLVNGTGQELVVSFSTNTASLLTVASVDVTVGNNGLDVALLVDKTTQTIQINTNYVSGGKLSATTIDPAADQADNIANAARIGVVVGGQTATVISAGDTFTLEYGGQTFTVNVTTSRSAPDVAGASENYITAGTYAVGEEVDFAILTGSIDAGSAGSGFSEQSVGSGLSAGSELGQNRLDAVGAEGVIKLTQADNTLTVTETDAKRVVGLGYTTELNNRISNLDSALSTLRSNSKTLGSNVAVLNTRLEFTKDYVNTLSAGAGKLTLADLNEEGANLLALQTRQQLGIQALAFAGQSEQAVLGLFR